MAVVQHKSRDRSPGYGTGSGAVGFGLVDNESAAACRCGDAKNDVDLTGCCCCCKVIIFVVDFIFTQ